MPVKRKVTRKAIKRVTKTASRSKKPRRASTTTSRRTPRYVPTFIEKKMGAALARLGIPHRAQLKVARVGRAAGRSYYLDFAIPDLMIAIECDGKAYHTTKRQKLADARRQAELEALGWTFVRFTGSEIVSNISRCEQVLVTLIKGTKT